MPDYYPEKDQCFDTWFSSRSGQHTLIVSDFSIAVFDLNDSEINKHNSYLFWDNGSKDETFKIENYIIAKLDTTFNDKYVFFRSVYNMADEKEFKVQIKANFILDGVNRVPVRTRTRGVFTLRTQTEIFNSITGHRGITKYDCIEYQTSVNFQLPQ